MEKKAGLHDSGTLQGSFFSCTAHGHSMSHVQTPHVASNLCYRFPSLSPWSASENLFTPRPGALTKPLWETLILAGVGNTVFPLPEVQEVHRWSKQGNDGKDRLYPTIARGPILSQRNQYSFTARRCLAVGQTHWRPDCLRIIIMIRII